MVIKGYDQKALKVARKFHISHRDYIYDTCKNNKIMTEFIDSFPAIGGYLFNYKYSNIANELKLHINSGMKIKNIINFINNYKDEIGGQLKKINKSTRKIKHANVIYLFERNTS